MRFSYKKSTTEYYVGKLMYIENEQSLYFEPFHVQSDFSVMISGAYTSLDIEIKNGEAKHISGCNPKYLWKSKNLQVPISFKGKLFVHFDAPIISGTGEYYATDWETYYDRQIGIICIGNPNTTAHDECIEFASGIIAVLREKELIAIWGKIKEVKSYHI